MPSTPSSVSRYRPAILVFTGAAAAYAAYLIYSSLQDAPSDGGLHRSNAVRRPNINHRRSIARAIVRIQQNVPPLGEFDFFGHAIELDARHVITPNELRDLALQHQPAPSPELINDRIGQVYDAFFDRLLALTFPRRPLSPTEVDAVTRWLGPNTNPAALVQAVQRYNRSFQSRETDAIVDGEETDSIPPTELSWPSDHLSDDDGLDTDGQTLQRTLYHIAEDRARQEGVIHRGITCNGCDTKPIRGTRWRCANCADFDLCSDCEATNSHIKTHIFYKIRVPAPYLGLPKQEPVYPGRPHLMSPSINSPLKKRLVSETKIEAEELEALWDQFTCLAGTEWEDDPNNVGWALDRRAFNQAFIPRYSTFISAPNLIYDRIFAYYDTDRNGLIGFEEFVKGLDGMHSRDQKIKIRIVFNGYDVDGDGYISRKDVLRIFRAYYAIEKEATRNYLAESAEELSVRGALDTIHSGQPLGSAFTQNSIPARTPGADQDRLREKLSMDPEAVAQVVRDDTDDTLDRADALRRTHVSQLFNDGPSEAAEQALRDRWARRQFYVDEEEGLDRPEGAGDTPPALDTKEQQVEETDNPPVTPQERPRGSRSSSRVRFQDDVDFDTRSNASTSSRPIGERWGGYEIPEPEKDLGKEILYQITQQAFNELLNPLFQEKEDNAMDAFATRAERRRLATQVDEANVTFAREKSLNKTASHLGVIAYSKLLVETITKSADLIKVLFKDVVKNSETSRLEIKEKLNGIISATEQSIVEYYPWPEGWESDPLDLWNAKLCREQLRHELVGAVIGLGQAHGWIPPDLPPPTSLHTVSHNQSSAHINEEENPAPYRDPTMPQFRPNSLADIQQTTPSAHQTAAPEPDETPSSATSTSDVTHMFGEETSDDVSDIHYTQSFGPYFVVKADYAEDGDPPSSPISNPATVETAVHDPQDPVPPPPSSNAALPPSLRLHPNLSAINDPYIWVLWINSSTMALHVEAQRARHVFPWERLHTYKPLERKIRREAMDKDSPLHILLLASLEVVEAEISERRNSGLLNFEEFEQKMKTGNLRFLEAWMDWVSF